MYTQKDLMNMNLVKKIENVKIFGGPKSEILIFKTAMVGVNWLWSAY